MLAWRKYDLFNYIMKLGYNFLGRPFICRVSFNSYEHMQQYIHSMKKPFYKNTSSPNDMNAIL